MTFTKVFIWAFMLTAPLPVPQRALEPKISPVTKEIHQVLDYTALEHCIIQKESGGNPQAVGRQGEYGLWQILPSTWSLYRCVGDPFNPLDNEKCARKIIKDDGYKQWSTFEYCKEKSHLPS